MRNRNHFLTIHGFLLQSYFLMGGQSLAPGEAVEPAKPRRPGNVNTNSSLVLSGAAAGVEFTLRAFGFMRNQPVGALLRAFTGFFISRPFYRPENT
jgi:hypothetical protein